MQQWECCQQLRCRETKIRESPLVLNTCGWPLCVHSYNQLFRSLACTAADNCAAASMYVCCIPVTFPLSPSLLTSLPPLPPLISF